MTCPKCRGSRHVRKGKAWIRCSCTRDVTNSFYILPNIRCGEENYPSELDQRSPLELKDIVVNGLYHDFRKMVWRSLTHYEATDLRYEYFDAYRLVEIFLGQDTTYTRVRDLDVLGMVIIALGVSDLPNRMLAPLVCQLLTQRKMAGQPTWVYTAKVGSALRSTYGNELTDLLGEVSPDVYSIMGKSLIHKSTGAKPGNFIGS